MGLIRTLIGALFVRGGAERLGRTVGDVAQVFRPNATRRMELGHDAFAAAHASHSAEFAHARPGWFDCLVNGLNRLPRPMLAVGTLGLFTYAMVDPPGFTVRMRGLAEVPEPLWWLLGAVVAFYFGAREAHHLREHRPVMRPVFRRSSGAGPATGDTATSDTAAGDSAAGDTATDPTTDPTAEPAAAPMPAPGARPRNPALSDWQSRHAAPATAAPADPLADPLGRER